MRLARAIIADLISAIEDVDPRMRYVNAQIDRATLAEARKFITKPQPELDWDVSLIRTALRRYVSPWSSEEEEALDRLAARPYSEEKALRDALKAICRRGPIMGSTGEYRRGQLNALEACRKVVFAALAEAKKSITEPELNHLAGHPQSAEQAFCNTAAEAYCIRRSLRC